MVSATGFGEGNLKHSLTIKLVLAFLVISLLTVLIVVVFAQRGTFREFDSYLYTNYQDTIANYFSQYYEKNSSWQGINSTLPDLAILLKLKQLNPDHLPFTLTDPTYRVILPGGFYEKGDVLLLKDQQGAIMIGSNGPEGYLVIPKPLPEMMPPPRDFTRNVSSILIYSGLAALMIALVVGYLLSRIITRPVLELTAAVQEISGGKLDQHIPVRSDDELGTLTKEFNSMAKKLAQLMQSRRQMTADIAHELRTPISVILGHAEGIHDGVIEPSAENLNIIREEAIRLEKLVEDLRTLSLSEAGELKLVFAKVFPGTLIDKISERYSHPAHIHGISFQTNYSAGLPEISIDSYRIMQVISNIIENALRNTPENGKISIDAEQVEEGIQFSIADSGNGISEEDLDRVFERLYKVDDSRGRTNGGSGLGLAIAKTIIEQHHGRIWLNSAVGVGTTVYLVLPIGS